MEEEAAALSSGQRTCSQVRVRSPKVLTKHSQLSGP